MRKKYTYEVLDMGIGDTKDAKIGKDIFYQCDICHKIISSVPKDNVGCECGNIFIDRDLHRLFVRDYSKFIILRKIPCE